MNQELLRPDFSVKSPRADRMGEQVLDQLLLGVDQLLLGRRPRRRSRPPTLPALRTPLPLARFPSPSWLTSTSVPSLASRSSLNA